MTLKKEMIQMLKNNLTTEETNKSYIHYINLTGDNTPNKYLTIETFIPYDIITNGSSTSEIFNLWQKIMEEIFCL